MHDLAADKTNSGLSPVFSLPRQHPLHFCISTTPAFGHPFYIEGELLPRPSVPAARAAGRRTWPPRTPDCGLTALSGANKISPLRGGCWWGFRHSLRSLSRQIYIEGGND